MTKFNLNNDQVSKLYQVKNIESQDEFLLLLENALVDSSRRICTSRKKILSQKILLSYVNLQKMVLVILKD